MSKVTIKDVARIANVSISTVSAALNPDSKKVSEVRRREILKIVDEIGYVRNVNAAGLASKKVKRVGFFLNHAPDYEISINAKLIYFINSEATKYNLEIINIFVDEIDKPDEYLLDKIKLHNLTDIILFGLAKDDEKIRKINHLEINKIFIDLPITGENSFFIAIDNYGAQEALTKKIISENMRSILYISGGQGSYVAIERTRAFKTVAAKAGINYEIIEGDFLRDTNYELIKTLDLGEFDAIMCGCDAAAVGVIQHLKETANYSKLVGGFDGINIIEHLNYPIYTVDQRIDLFAEAAIDMIVKDEYATKIIDFTIKGFGTTKL